MKIKYVVIGLLILISFILCWFFIVKNNRSIIRKADKFTLEELPACLLRLQQGKMEYPFFGITSNGIDCIYFVREGDKFNIEFEAIIKEQLPYIVKLKDYSEEKKYKFSVTTYGNKPKYPELQEAPVISIEIFSDIKNTTEIGKEIQKFIFENKESTIYEVIP